ncbi:tetratricopeptide repeat protein [Isoptericola sp. S6320L]|uniref:tetratricopeptide repeat protein n=1 Tax=Isoptericola sp. S6320L TaxID=2926411 RepID=UPI001FF30C47|nr:tetratricopeptide repeat protein [Isoptericola sp. S6320L]MCK0116514.1 tetratricopeptide repeat protein [Isoptericola sp. S6320L]
MTAGSPPGHDPVAGQVTRAEMLVDAGRPEQALDGITAALAEHPDDVRLHLTSGWLHLRLQRSADARRILEQVVAGAPDLAQGHVLLSVALQNCGRLAEARAAVERALELRPDDAATLVQHADVLLSGRVRHRDRGLARDRVARALELEPENPSRLLGAASIHVRLGERDRARALVRHGLAAAPQHEGLLYADAQLSVDDGQHSRALVGILAQNPEHAEAGYVLFLRVWQRLLAPMDTAVAVLTASALLVAWFMSDSLHGSLRVWAVVLAVALGVSALRSWSVLRHVPRVLVRRSLLDGTWSGRLGAAGLVVGWVGSVLALAALVGLRDAVAVRWFLVLLALTLLVAGTGSAVLAGTMLRHARSSGYLAASELGLARTSALRGSYRAATVRRAVVVALVALLSAAAAAGAARPDALPVAALGAVAWLLPGVLVVWRLRALATALRREGAEPVGAARTAVAGRARGAGGLAVLALVTVALGAAGLVAVAQVPVLPNEHDADGRYVTTPDSGDSDPTCSGSRYTRISCALRDNREQMEDWEDREPIDIPTFDLEVPDIPELDVPDLPEVEVPDIEVPEDTTS